MLKAIMNVRFFPKDSDLYKDWEGYDATRVFRPAFNIGGALYSASITSDEQMYFWNEAYTVWVDFFTIDSWELYINIKKYLVVGEKYNIQAASKIIGEAIMYDFMF